MEIFEIEGPDGTIYEVEAESAEQAAQAFDPKTFADATRNTNALNRLEGLEAKGELRPAEKQALRELRSGSGASAHIIGETGATYRGAQQGVTFQQADEIGGLFRGAGHKANMRAKDEEAERLYPDQFNKGKTAGAVASGLAAAPIGGSYIKGAQSLPAIMGRSGIVGGIEGLIWGSGAGEGLKEKAGNAARSGAIGAGVSAFVPPAIMGGARATRAMGDVLGSAFNVNNAGRAKRAISEALTRSGKSADDVSQSVALAGREGQPEFRNMDAMGIAGQRLTNSIVRAGDDGAEEIAQFLRQRQAGQAERVGAQTADAFGAQQTADATRSTLKTGRDDAAHIAYDAARGNAAPVDARGAIGVIDDRIGGMSGSNIAGDSIDGKLARFRDRLMADPAPEGEISRELSDFNRVLGVKQDVSDAIGAATRAGRNNEARELRKLRNALDSALEDASPSYRAANDEYATGSRVIGAVDEGEAMARPSNRAADTTGRFSEMTPDEKGAARVGYADKQLAKIESNASPTSDKSKQFRSPKVSQESGVMAKDPELFARQIQREGDMWETQNRALGGSRTADNLQDISNTGAMGNVMRAMRAAGNLKLGEAAQHAGAAVAPALQGRNKATREMIAQALMAAQSNDVLAPAERMAARNALMQMLLEGGARGAARGGLTQ